MGKMQCDTKWQGGLCFSTQIRGHHFMMDSKSDPESQDRGPTPKELVLAGICGCSGIDVASILKKMRADVQSCEVEGFTDTTEGQPSIFKEVLLKFKLRGSTLKPEQIVKAVTLSMTKYCGVSAMVIGVSPIRYEIYLNDELIHTAQADFSKAFAELGIES